MNKPYNAGYLEGLRIGIKRGECKKLIDFRDMIVDRLANGSGKSLDLNDILEDLQNEIEAKKIDIEHEELTKEDYIINHAEKQKRINIVSDKIEEILSQ